MWGKKTGGKILSLSVSPWWIFPVGIFIPKQVKLGLGKDSQRKGTRFPCLQPHGHNNVFAGIGDERQGYVPVFEEWKADRAYIFPIKLSQPRDSLSFIFLVVSAPEIVLHHKKADGVLVFGLLRLRHEMFGLYR